MNPSHSSAERPQRPDPGPAPSLPRGFRAAGVSCGLKRRPGAKDVTLIVADADCTAAGVFTQNRVVAAPVQLSHRRVPSAKVRAVVVNSGNANACTGTEGLENARRMARRTAQLVGCSEEQVLVCSTGVIGTPLPIERVENGIEAAYRALVATADGLEAAAHGIWTTDTAPKWAQRRVADVSVSGFCKGAAMLAPNLATMLGFVLTDAVMPPESAADALRAAVDKSFNAISIDGHTSTNDTVLLLCSGAAGTGGDAVRIRQAIDEVCIDLAKAIVADAEGGTHRITVDVEGAADHGEARKIARAIADSPLVKTAVHGADPNWGRIVSAAGYAGVPFREDELTLWLNGVLVYEHGTPQTFDDAALSRSLRSQFETAVRVQLQRGDGRDRFWACDLTADYVRLNADYRT